MSKKATLAAAHALAGRAQHATTSDDAMKLSQAALNLTKAAEAMPNTQEPHDSNAAPITIETQRRVLEHAMPRIVESMAIRFMSWKLPPDFSPDGGVHFDPRGRGAHTWPTGTNLLTHGQALSMLQAIWPSDWPHMPETSRR